MSIPTESWIRPMLSDLHVPEVLEHAFAEHLARQVAAWQAMSACRTSRIVRIGGGVAALTRPVFGRKLNRVSGMGMTGPVTDTDFAELESSFEAHGSALEVDVCPHAHASLSLALDERGYLVRAFSNAYVMNLERELPAFEPVTGIRVINGRLQEQSTFVDNYLAGFRHRGRGVPLVLLETLARLAVHREDNLLFTARVYGHNAGTAGLSLIDTEWGRVGHLHMASTLPEFRGLGVQKTLLHARIEAAREAGCRLASITGRPRDGSARHAERAGFRLAYTTATFTRGRDES